MCQYYHLKVKSHRVFLVFFLMFLAYMTCTLDNSVPLHYYKHLEFTFLRLVITTLFSMFVQTYMIQLKTFWIIE